MYIDRHTLGYECYNHLECPGMLHVDGRYNAFLQMSAEHAARHVAVHAHVPVQVAGL